MTIDRLHARMLALTAALAAVALLAVPALAAHIDTASDRAALAAYDKYMSSLNAGITAASDRDDAFAASVRKGCAGVLSSLPPDRVDSPAVVDLGHEIGDDVAVEFDAQAVPAFTKLSSALGRLGWSSSATARTVAAVIAAMRGSLAIKPSRLCADAHAVASAPASEPVRTRRFLSVYAPAARAASRWLTAFLGVLGRFETSSEAGLIAAVNRLVTRYQSASSTDQGDASAQIISILGSAAP